MYIEPNTVIKILQSVPLDKTYTNTIIFNSAYEQQAYFSGKTKFTLSNQTYQRAQQNIMRVEIKAEELYDCNYLMFQNTSFGNKWFYAFIKEVEYINNSVSQITYELDVMQTWLFDYQLEQCFVEREHSATDNLFENTIPENLETGEYVQGDNNSIPVSADKIVIAATFFKDGDSFVDFGGGRYNGVFSGVYYTVFDSTAEGAKSCAKWILEATKANKADGIVSVFEMCSKFITDIGAGFSKFEVTFNKNTEKIGEYIPRNKKLFCYPYNFFYLANLRGDCAVYRYEDFKSDIIKFTVYGDMNPTPSVLIAPHSYLFDLDVPNYDEKLTLKGYPQCTFNVDSYKAWLAQNGASFAVNSGVSAVGAIGGIMAAPATAGASLVATANLGGVVLSNLAQIYQKSAMPMRANGSSGSSLIPQAFISCNKHIKEEYAKIIDEYFDMFGYATHRVKVPNRNVRPHWCYTKTAGCIIKGSIPSDDEEKICNIYNNGITFWKNGDEIGNYNLDNRV